MRRATTPLLALCAALIAAPALAAPTPGTCTPSCPGSKELPAASLQIPLTFDSGATRYLMTLGVGTPPQSTALVVDTGSGSFYDAFYAPAESSTAKDRKITAMFGYGSGPIGPVTFYRDTMSLPVADLSGGSTSSIDVKSYKWVGAVATPRAAGGLIGWSPPGWNQHAMPTPDPKLIAGSLCKNQTHPCGNTPTAPQALLKAAKLKPMFSLNLNTDPTANGGVNAGYILLGGVDGSLAAGPYIPTPLAPNLYRKDFYTGSSKYVFWQIVPLNMTIIDVQGKVLSTLCSATDVTDPSACTIILDTGYGGNVAKDATARAALQAATSATAGTPCAASLLLYLPTQKKGRAPQPLSIPLTQGGSGNCAQVLVPPSSWGPAPQKLDPILPAAWFVFGQPMLQRLSVAFSFNAYGSGGIFLAPRASG